MSQVKKILIPALLLLGLLLLLGCGDPNAKASFSVDSQKHAAGWLPVDHKTAAEGDVRSCEECHGADLSGGISGVSCSSCHLGGPGSTHPQAWGELVAINHSPYVDTNGSTACANAACHGADLSGIPQSGPSCSSCHLGGPTSIHPLDWNGYPVYFPGGGLATNHGEYLKEVLSLDACSNIYCHGVNLEGVEGSGHSCVGCHY